MVLVGGSQFKVTEGSLGLSVMVRLVTGPGCTPCQGLSAGSMDIAASDLNP